MDVSLKDLPQTELLRLILETTFNQMAHNKDMSLKDALYDTLSQMDEVEELLKKYPQDE